MQQTGTLKKRRRRNLAKVNGLCAVPYDTGLDSYAGQSLFGGGESYIDDPNPKPFSVRTSQDTRLRFSSNGMRQNRREASGGMPSSRFRATRDPNFHENPDENDLDKEARARDIGSGSMRNEGDATADWEQDTGPFSKRANLAESIRDRSHFLDTFTMKRLKQLIWVAITSGSLPWRWNAKEYRIDQFSPTFEKIWWVQWTLFMIQTVCLAAFQIYVFTKSVSVGHKTYREVFVSSLSFIWYLYSLGFSTIMFFYKDQIRHYINTLLKFNHEMMEKYVIHLDDYKDGGRLVIRFTILNNIFHAFVKVSLFVFMPYHPWYLFSYIYPKPWYWLIPGAIQQYMMVGQVVTTHGLITWIVVAHANSVQFWLREIHNNNDSDYTTDDLRSPKTSIEVFRSLQILMKSFNNCMSPMAIPLIKIDFSSFIVLSGYTLIRSMNHIFIDEFPGILSFPVAVMDCTSAGFTVMTMTAEVFDLGCSFIDSWSRTRHKDFRRILMSCPTLKTWVGRFYYITVGTTIVFFKIICDLVTDAIIAFP